MHKKARKKIFNSYFLTVINTMLYNNTIKNCHFLQCNNCLFEYLTRVGSLSDLGRVS